MMSEVAAAEKRLGVISGGMDLYTKKEHLSQSSACTFDRCKAKYFFASGCRFERGEAHCALKFGTAIHYAIGYAFRGDLETAMEKFREVYLDTQDPSGVRTPAKARQMLNDFMKTHQGHALYKGVDPPKGIDIEERVSEDEVPFAIDVGIEVPVVGRVDRLGRNSQTGALWGVEYKTSREISSRYFDNFGLCPQTWTYHLALSMLCDEPVVGVYIETLQAAKTKICTQAFPFYIEEHMDEAIMGWYRNIYAEIQECERTGEWPQSFSMCAPYSSFGIIGYPCEFRDLCKSYDWLSLAPSLYEVGEERPFTIKQDSTEDLVK